MGRRRAPRLDLDALPRDVRRTVEAAVVGEEVEVVRGERVLGALTYRPAVLEGIVLPADRADETPPPPDGVTVVATAVPMSERARQLMSDRLGDDYVVLDVSSAPDTADVLLVHPVSPQLIGLLQERFPRARLLVTEIDDDELGVHQRGPVSRLLDAGAAAYLPPQPLAAVAAAVRTQVESTCRALGSADTVAEEPPLHRIDRRREP